MANTLNTRIILRNDTTSGWSEVKDTVVLLKGEVGLEFVTTTVTAASEGLVETPTGKVKMKIGDGVSTWSELSYFGGDECHVTEITVTSGSDHIIAINEELANTTINKGDIAIVKEGIIPTEELGTNTQKYQYTSYVYGDTADGAAWKAMDGNYNAKNIYFPEDMLITQNVGYCTITNGQGYIPSKGKNLMDVFETMYVKETNPTTTQPSVSFNSVTSGRYEVGTKVTPQWNVKFNTGSYSYGPATGLIATWAISDTDGHSATAASGSFEEFQVIDNTSYTITAKATYGDGAIPVTNKGNEYAAGQIKAGSKSATSNKIYGERKAFYGAFVTPIDIEGSAIRTNCTNKWHNDTTSSSYYSGAGCTLTIPEGTTQVVIALYGKTLKSVYDSGAFGTDIMASFILQTETDVSIKGANEYTGVVYNVYVYRPQAALGANTYYIKIG